MSKEDDLRATFERESLPAPAPTCAECRHVERCRFILGFSFRSESTICDWAPSRFSAWTDTSRWP